MDSKRNIHSQTLKLSQIRLLANIICVWERILSSGFSEDRFLTLNLKLQCSSNQAYVCKHCHCHSDCQCEICTFQTGVYVFWEIFLISFHWELSEIGWIWNETLNNHIFWNMYNPVCKSFSVWINLSAYSVHSQPNIISVFALLSNAAKMYDHNIDYMPFKV